MVPPQHPHDIQTQRSGVIPRQHRILRNQLRLDLGQLLQNLDTNVDQPINIQRKLHQIEQERHVLLHRQIIRVPRRKRVQHLDHRDAALPRDDVLVEVAQTLALLRRGLEVELVAGVLLDFAALGDVHAEFFREQLADFFGHFLDGVARLVADFPDAVQEHVALVAVVLREGVVLREREVRRVQQVARRFDLVVAVVRFHGDVTHGGGDVRVVVFGAVGDVHGVLLVFFDVLEDFVDFIVDFRVVVVHWVGMVLSWGS